MVSWCSHSLANEERSTGLPSTGIVRGVRANFSTVARKSFAVKGEDWRKAGT